MAGGGPEEAGERSLAEELVDRMLRVQDRMTFLERLADEADSADPTPARLALRAAEVAFFAEHRGELHRGEPMPAFSAVHRQAAATDGEETSAAVIRRRAVRDYAASASYELSERYYGWQVTVAGDNSGGSLMRSLDRVDEAEPDVTRGQQRLRGIVTRIDAPEGLIYLVADSGEEYKARVIRSMYWGGVPVDELTLEPPETEGSVLALSPEPE